MRVQHQYEPLYCRYNLATGQTTYIVLNANRENRFLLNTIGEHVGETPMTLHPLTLQTVVMFHALATRATETDDLFRRLLWVENQIYQGSIFDGTNAEAFTRYIQLSHKMSRNLITLEHRNQRDASHISRLLRDHERLWKLTRQYTAADRQIDPRMHERVRDSLLCLRDFAEDRERQILNLQRKTQNFITLLYHLITGHDSSINLRIAAQTASVAHESKKDSTSMKIIAGVTMFYLPATFVCSLFGTNLVALNTNDTEPRFVVSPLWWLYVVFAVPLTALTIFGFVLWRRWREGDRIRRLNGSSV
jgi:Mg2+ and Co2+ transporter CorA